MLLTSTLLPRGGVEAAVPDDFLVLGSVPGHADVQLTAWRCEAIAVDNATVVPDGVVAFLTALVQARNETWNRPGYFGEFLLEAWVGDTALQGGLAAHATPTQVADRADVAPTGVRLVARNASHAVAGAGGSLGDNPFGGDLGVRYFGVDGAGDTYAWDVAADVAGAELLPRAAQWTFEGGAAGRLAGGAGPRAAHVQAFTASYAFEPGQFGAAA